MDFQVINRVKRSARHVYPKFNILIITKKVSEYNHTLQTNPWHCEEEPQNTNSHKQSVKQPSLSSSSR